MKQKNCNWTGIVVKSNSETAYRTAIKLIQQAREIGEDIRVLKDTVFSDTNSLGDIDFFVLEKDKPCRIIVVGGDGTLLRLLQYHDIEDAIIATIGAGRRCYFFDIDNTEIDGFLRKFVNGEYVEHRMWRLYIENNGKSIGKAMNEIVIAGDNTRVIKLSVLMGERKIYDITGDGVIVATTQGSTAYSLSAGGPIVDPLLKSMIITPLNPVQLHIRPIVLEPFSTITIKIPEQEITPRIIIDGMLKRKIHDNVELKIRIHEKPVRFARFRWVRFYERIFKPEEK